MALETHFKDFLQEINLTPNQKEDLKMGHITLRERLMGDDKLAPIIVNVFLQGSYKRSTAVRPKNGNRSDVDIIVVTNIDPEKFTPQKTLNLFIPFLEKYYKGKYRVQGRSIGISLSYVDLDIVPTSAPSEIQRKELDNSIFNSDFVLENYQITSQVNNENQWKNEPLLIPDREAGVWNKTNPLEQIDWTRKKNQSTNGHYIQVVKCLKWWRKEQYPDMKHPKSYPLEHFIGECCPDGIKSVDEGIVKTLENIVNYHPRKPVLPDRGVPEHDVFGRITDEEYNEFYDTVCVAFKIARKAFDSDFDGGVKGWGELFGNKFPLPKTSVGGYTPRKEKTEEIPERRYA